MHSDEDIFLAAAALPAADRPGYLDGACAGEPEQRARVDALLRSHEAEGFMENQTLRAPCGGAGDSPLFPLECPGQRIGRYRLIEPIGEGGFGVVWMAEQVEPVTRQVALKLLKPGLDTREVIARFEAERQAVAMMDHPHIAKVHDAGATETGRPFFVMELVKGIPITRFCDENEFSTRQRLELFADVCSAINHAHQKGVIHRDIKPSNVLVTIIGDQPVVKVIDFGIAKATRGRLTDKTLFTRFEQIIGTPAYMSPEQAANSEGDIDTRSDIYSLGVLLYELLTGRPPFLAKSLAAAGCEGMRRIIREVEPEKPSVRLGTALDAERIILAKARNVELEKLHHTVEPDLDWIVMKAIEKERERRYETANGLALDIQRFLADEPVSAGPPSARYRLRKFSRRHKAILRMTAAIAAVLVTATVVSASQAFRAFEAAKNAHLKAMDEAAARGEAVAAKRNAEALSLVFSGLLQRADPSRGGRDMTVNEAIQQLFIELDDEFTHRAEQSLESHYHVLRDLHHLGFTREVIPLQEKAHVFFRNEYGPSHVKSLRSSVTLALYILRGSEEETRLERADGILDELLADEKKGPRLDVLDLLETTVAVLAQGYADAGRHEEALRVRQKFLLSYHAFGSRRTRDATMAVVAAHFAAGEPDRADAQFQLLLADFERERSALKLYRRDPYRKESIALDLQFLELCRKYLGENHSYTQSAMGRLNAPVIQQSLQP